MGSPRQRFWQAAAPTGGQSAHQRGHRRCSLPLCFPRHLKSVGFGHGHLALQGLHVRSLRFLGQLTGLPNLASHPARGRRSGATRHREQLRVDLRCLLLCLGLRLGLRRQHLAHWRAGVKLRLEGLVARLCQPPGDAALLFSCCLTVPPANEPALETKRPCDTSVLAEPALGGEVRSWRMAAGVLLKGDLAVSGVVHLHLVQGLAALLGCELQPQRAAELDHLGLCAHARPVASAAAAVFRLARVRIEEKYARGGRSAHRPGIQTRPRQSRRRAAPPFRAT